MADYIKLYRKMLDNPVIFKDNDHLAMWIHLLLTVNWGEADVMFDGKRITLKPGQNIYGRKRLSEELHISESKCERILTLFKSEQQIEQQTSSKNRLITILNWSSYQKSEQQNEQQTDNKWTTSEQQVDTKEEEKKNKKNKNKKINTKDIGVFAQYSGDNLPLLTALNDFEAMRKATKRPMTERAKELLVAKLSKMPGDPIDILNQSIVKNWSDVYPLKESRVEPIPDYTPSTPPMSQEDIDKLKERLRRT